MAKEMTPQYKAAREAANPFPNEEGWDRQTWNDGYDAGYAQALAKWAQGQAENSDVIAAKDAEIGRLKAALTMTGHTYLECITERDEWKQQAERLRGALELADKTLKKIHDHAKECADIYDREWMARHPGADKGFCANMWRAAEQHILMCSSFFKTESQHLLAEYAAWKGEG
jgi:hypothetical protein